MIRTLAACLAASLVLTPLIFAQEGEPASVVEPLAPDLQPSQWRVIWTTDPQHQATISWSTWDVGTSHRVRIAKTDQDGVEGEWLVDAHRSGVYSKGGDDPEQLVAKSYHHALVTGLEPGVTYRFNLESDGVLSPTMTFRAAPSQASSEAFSLLYGGDSRTGKEDRQRMNELSAGLVRQTPNVVAFLHGGDYVFDGKSLSMWDEWLSHDELRTTESGRVIPIIPTRGNHDVGPLFDEVFDTPGGKGKNYYATTLSFGVNLLTLNSNISHAGDQKVWLKQQLEELRPASRWLLAQYHRPAFPAVKEAGPAKMAWVPHFEHHNVDLVFESDGHTIKRTLPIRDEGHDPSGVVYIGEGGLGVPQRVPHSNRWYLQPPGMSARGHHLTLVTFSGDTLELVTQGFQVDEATGRIDDPTGEPFVFDEYSMTMRK